ncbi:MAG TPA: peptidoglycan DD-metalloendopeptidase family protein [Actinomycetota bacterium]|nr:peptidoglycan DD-metalloendopeptidase family protein [Actinomycetota bacterium]
MAQDRIGKTARRRATVLLAVLMLLSGLAPGASADPKAKLQQARARLEQIKKEITAQQAVLNQLSAQAAALAQRLDEAQAKYEYITSQLQDTRQKLQEATDRFHAVQTQLNSRTRETYMDGPGSPLEFLLGATSFTDLSDRVEFVDAVTQTDADLANQVQNLRNELAAQQHDQQKLQAKQAEVLRGLQADQAQLDAQFVQQRSVLDDIQAKKAEAEKLVSKATREYKQWLRSLTAPVDIANNPFHVCPVDQPRAVYDGFGAPRYAGGYHPHAGNDIVAPPGTPIRAPFDGTARSSYNTLGGNAVYVYGPQGYVYNAHLSQYSSSSDGSVRAGEIIGYVGNTGDAQGGVTHDHFEWHPNAMPSDWQKSPYGYSAIGTAVNPYPLLAQVCL